MFERALLPEVSMCLCGIASISDFCGIVVQL
jgi:hypothetical protein